MPVSLHRRNSRKKQLKAETASLSFPHCFNSLAYHPLENSTNYNSINKNTQKQNTRTLHWVMFTTLRELRFLAPPFGTPKGGSRSRYITSFHPLSREAPKVTMTSSEVLRFLRSTMNSEPCLWSLVFFLMKPHGRGFTQQKKCVVKHQEKTESFFWGGHLLRQTKTQMNDTNLHDNLLIHVLCSLRTSNLRIRVRFGRGQIRTCPKHKIPHFQGFKRNEVHNSSWQTTRIQIHEFKSYKIKNSYENLELYLQTIDASSIPYCLCCFCFFFVNSFESE